MKVLKIRGGFAASMVLGITALSAAAQGQTAPGAAPRAAAPAPAARPAPQQAAPTAQTQAFNTVQQVCQMREREIAMVNSQLLLRNQLFARETDAGRRAQITAPLAELRASLRETEASWQRMDCVRLLYGR